MEMNTDTGRSSSWSEEKCTMVAVTREQINQCRVEISNYNVQFLSSSVLCAVLASISAVLATKEDSPLWTLFYVLPTIFLFALYNLVKYTIEQINLGAYRKYLEEKLNSCLEEPILCWEDKIPKGGLFYFFGGAVQGFFYIPIGIVLFWGMWKLEHNRLWWIFFISNILQSIIIFIMIIILFYTRENALKAFGYDVEPGWMKILRKFHLSSFRAKKKTSSCEFNDT